MKKKKYSRVFIELSAIWGNGDVGSSIRISRRRWKAIQEGAKHTAISTSYYEGTRFTNFWTFASAKVNIDGEDGMECVVDLPVDELYVDTIIIGE